MIKLIFFVLGTFSLITAVIGIYIPGLPTTPFLLLSATLYSRSSNRLYKWLINHPFLGRFIKNYRERKAITVKAKWISIVLMWTMITISSLLCVNNLHLRIFLIILGLTGTFFMGRIRTYKDE